MCRIKNKFLQHESEVEDGYRDVSLNVIHESTCGLRIIGEIQVGVSVIIVVGSSSSSMLW